MARRGGAQCLYGRNAGGCARGGRGCGQGSGKATGLARRHPAWHQGSVRDAGRRHHGGQPHPQGLQAAVRKHRHRQPAQGGGGDARQAQHGRVRDGLVERDQRLRAGDQPVAAQGQQCRADAGRIVGRLGGGGRGRHRTGRHRHRHRRLDPPAGGLRRHLRDQADLRPLLALGHRRVRKLARPGGADGEERSRLRDPARGDGRLRPEGFDFARPAGAASGKRICRAISSGKRVGIPKEYRIDGVPAEINDAVGPGHRMAAGRGRDAGRDQPAAHQICAADLLHHRSGRSLVEPRAL